MADIKLKYPVSGGTALTCTLTSLASSLTAGRASTYVDNSTDLNVDALVTVKVKTVAGTIANDRAVYVYAYGYDGSIYTANATGSDAAITLDDPTTMQVLGMIPVPAANTTYQGGPWSLARLFGGVIPSRWGIVVRNYTGLALSATADDLSVRFLPVQLQSV